MISGKPIPSQPALDATIASKAIATEIQSGISRVRKSQTVAISNNNKATVSVKSNTVVPFNSLMRSQKPLVAL
jgi:hypothetical protein